MRDLGSIRAEPGVHAVAVGDDGMAIVWRGLRIIASNGEGWDHVSVSRPDRTPTWEEMKRVHRLFFPEECAMQLHVESKDHINVHKYCLHLWRPQNTEIPRPPKDFV